MMNHVLEEHLNEILIFHVVQRTGSSGTSVYNHFLLLGWAQPHVVSSEHTVGECKRRIQMNISEMK